MIFSVEHLFTSLEAMAESDAIDAVYIASPNSLHFSQTQLFLSHKINVICEKPLASNLAEVDAAIACARENQVVLFEAFKTACLPNFHLLRQCAAESRQTAESLFQLLPVFLAVSTLPGMVRIPTPLIRHSLTVQLWISVFTVWRRRWRYLVSRKACRQPPVCWQAALTPSGVVVMDYGDFSVTLQHSKVSDSVLASEIQGEAGSLVIEKLSECQKVCFVPRGSQMQDLTQPQHINTMLYEAELFATPGG